MQAVFLAAPPPPPAGHPAVVAFWDLRRGLYVRGGTVSLTADGGRTFRVVLRRRQRITGLQAFDRRDAIVDLYDGRALRTLDGGRGWRAFTHRFGADFATARVGVGYRTGQFEFVKGLVFTRDDGRSWERLRSPCPRFAANSAGVELVTPLRGWIVCAGQPSAGQQVKALFSTSDGGRTWRRRGGARWSGYVEGAAFAQDGFGLVWTSRGTLNVTRDGGDHWFGRPDVAQPELDFGGGGAAFPGGRGLVFLSRGDGAARLLTTSDSGRTWRVVHRWP